MTAFPTDDAGTPEPPQHAVLPDAATVAMVDAIHAEGGALDLVLARARGVLMLQTAGQFDHLERAVRDLDAASAALATSSRTRESAVSAAVGPVADRHELVRRCPEMVADVVADAVAHQHVTLLEVGEVSRAITDGAKVATVSLQRRRRELERKVSGSVTYEAPRRP